VLELLIARATSRAELRWLCETLAAEVAAGAEVTGATDADAGEHGAKPAAPGTGRG
jgi:hypothetical protein